MYVGVNNLKKDIEDGVHLVLAQAGEKWVNYLEQYSDEVEQLIKLTRNKRRFYQQGMRAATLIRSISIASLSPPARYKAWKKFWSNAVKFYRQL